LAGRAKLVQAYAEDLSPKFFKESEFDAILFSYSLSMIPDWREALHAAVMTLAQDGTLHIVDFGDLKGLGRAVESLLRGWLGLFHVEPREDLLKTLEKDFAHGQGLVLLPGRYAFVLSCSADKATCTTSSAVP
jgi:S-adenosylmethionine-diacylgycerolhomoserine-N-methlytransferase